MTGGSQIWSMGSSESTGSPLVFWLGEGVWKIVFFFLLTILEPPGGYRFLARRRVRSSLFVVDRAGFEPAALRSTEVPILQTRSRSRTCQACFVNTRARRSLVWESSGPRRS